MAKLVRKLDLLSNTRKVSAKPAEFKPKDQSNFGEKRRGNRNRNRNRNRNNRNRDGRVGGPGGSSMGWNSGGRGNQGPHSNSSRHESYVKKPAVLASFETGKQQVFLFDEDDFYGITIDMVLYNLDRDSSVKVESNKLFSELISKIDNPASIFVIDELFFAEGKLIEAMKEIKARDKSAKIIIYTVAEELAEADEGLVDNVILKSGRSNSLTITKALAEIFDVEVEMNNQDPERE